MLSMSKFIHSRSPSVLPWSWTRTITQVFDLNIESLCAWMYLWDTQWRKKVAGNYAISWRIIFHPSHILKHYVSFLRCNTSTFYSEKLLEELSSSEQYCHQTIVSTIQLKDAQGSLLQCCIQNRVGTQCKPIFIKQFGISMQSRNGN